MATPRSLEFRVGALLVLALVLLGGFIVALGNFSLRASYVLYVDYDYVGNLRPGAPVKLAGIEIGSVSELAFWAGKEDLIAKRRVQVRAKLRVETRAAPSVREGAEFYINTAGVLGEQYIEIVPSRDWSAPQLAAERVVMGINPPRTDLVVARLYEVVDGVAAVLRDDKEAITNLLQNSAQTMAEVNQFMQQNRSELHAMLKSGTALAQEATAGLGVLREGLGSPSRVSNALARVETLMDAATLSLQTLTPKASAVMGDVSTTLGHVTEARVDRVLGAIDQAVGVTTTADGLLRNVDGMVTDIRAGKGTAGGLVAKNDIYDDLRELIADLKRNPWKLFWKE